MDVLTCDIFPEEMNCNQFQQSINEAFYDTLDDDDDIIPPTPQKRMMMMMNHRTKESRLLRNHQKGKSAATTAVCVVKYQAVHLPGWTSNNILKYMSGKAN